MENVMIVDDKLKRKVGIICFIPAVCFGLSLLYYLIILSPLLHGTPQPKSVVGITSNNYDTLFLMLATSAVISACVLLYCVVHIARIRTMNTPTKMKWALLLVGVVPFSFIIFWWFQFKREPRNMPVYPSIS